MKKITAVVLGLVGLGMTLPAGAASRGFIGDTGSGWSTTSKVSARASWSHPSRLPANTIDGSGLDAAGEIHDTGDPSGTMWHAYSLGLQNPSLYRGGTEDSSYWIEYKLDQAYPIDQMLIWNYTEGDPGGYGWSSVGIKNVTIQYTTIGGGGPDGTWGSPNPSDWTTIYVGTLNVYNPGDPRVANNVINFNGARARYVVVTADDTSQDTLNWTVEKRGSFTEAAGLSEVRFYPKLFRGFIGDTGTGWDTTSKVAVRANYEHPSKLAINTINGSGLDATIGDIHDNAGGNMWMSTEAGYNPRGGTVGGGHWIEFKFDQSYRLGQMWIWNYTEGDVGGYAWSAMGLRQVTIQYTTVGGGGGDGTWGSINPSDWTTLYTGDLNVYNPGQSRNPNTIIDFGGSQARYVVITTSNDVNMNWMLEKRGTFNDDSGLSEVRFFEQPPLATHDVQGIVVLGDYGGDIQDVGLRVELRQNGQPVRTERMFLGADGGFVVTGVEQGTYEIALKSCAWLQKVVNVEVNADPTDLGTVELINGDSDGDNEVTTSDLATVLLNMDMVGD